MSKILSLMKIITKEKYQRGCQLYIQLSVHAERRSIAYADRGSIAHVDRGGA